MTAVRTTPQTRWPRVAATAVGLVAVVAVVVLAFLWPSVIAEPRDLLVAVAGEPAVVAQVQVNEKWQATQS